MALPSPVLRAFQRWPARIAAIAVTLLLVALFIAPRAVFFGWLLGFLFWSGIPLGAAAILMLHHLTGGRWGWPIRPLLRMGVLGLLVIPVGFFPLVFGMTGIAEHVGQPEHAGEHGHDPLAAKRVYLDEPLLFLRSAVYLTLWAVGGWLLFRNTPEDPGGPGFDEPRQCATGLAAGGLILYVLSMSFAAIDWFGTLEPQWFSSIFGLYIIIGQALTAMAVLIVVLLAPAAAGIRRAVPMPPATPDVLHDLGNLLLAMVILHAYFGYSQFFIIWNGNLPHELLWFEPRIHGAWGWVAAGLMLVHFGLPFALLLSRRTKRNPGPLLMTASMVLAARVVESAWVVLPSAHGRQLSSILVAIPAFLVVGGITAAGFAWLFWRLARLAPARAEVDA